MLRFEYDPEYHHTLGVQITHHCIGPEAASRMLWRFHTRWQRARERAAWTRLGYIPKVTP